MAPKTNSTKKKTPKKQAFSPTRHLRNDPTNDKESSGSVEKYSLAGAVEPRKNYLRVLKLLQGEKNHHPVGLDENLSQSPYHSSS